VVTCEIKLFLYYFRTSLPKVIWEEGRVAAVLHTGRAVASMHSRNVVGECGVAFIHEYG